jgi:GAF domain-containing protein
MVTERRELARLLTVQQRLLEIPASTPFDVATMLNQAATLVQEALGAEKVDVFLHDPTRAALVAVGISASDLARREGRLGLDVLPLDEGGRFVGVFRTGASYRTGRAERDRQELRRMREDLGVRSSMAVPLVVQQERIGVLAAVSTQPAANAAADLCTLELLAGLTGLIVDSSSEV